MSVQSGQATRELSPELWQAPPRVSLRVGAQARNLRILRRLIRESMLECGCSDDCTRDAVIAVDEACQNVIRHAYGDTDSGDVIVEIRSDGEHIAFSIIDFAAPVDPETVHPRALDELRPGGLGTHFINECMDAWGFRQPPQGAGNCLWMAKKIE